MPLWSEEAGEREKSRERGGGRRGGGREVVEEENPANRERNPYGLSGEDLSKLFAVDDDLAERASGRGSVGWRREEEEEEEEEQEEEEEEQQQSHSDEVREREWLQGGRSTEREGEARFGHQWGAEGSPGAEEWGEGNLGAEYGQESDRWGGKMRDGKKRKGKGYGDRATRMAQIKWPVSMVRQGR